jgi:ribosomal protein S18 acetylase RimI-like enzyme
VTASDDRSAAPVLRPATPEDEPFLRELYRVTRSAEFAALPLEPAQLRALCDSQFDAQLAGYGGAYPQVRQFVVASRDEPAGRLITARDATSLWLLDIALMPAFRGRGWGGQLVRGLQDEARASARALRLHVEMSSPWLAWYQRVGFVVEGASGMHYELRWT